MIIASQKYCVLFMSLYSRSYEFQQSYRNVALKPFCLLLCDYIESCTVLNVPMHQDATI